MKVGRHASRADVAELADALDSGSSGGNPVEVQVLSSAPSGDSLRCAALGRRTFLLLCAALSAGCRPAPKHSRVDAAIAPLLPGSSAALAGLRIDRLKNKAWFRPFLQGRKPAALRRFEQCTGMDLARDVWEVVWSLSAGGSVAFLRGKFGGSFGQEPRFDAPGISRRNYKTYYVLEKDGLTVLFLGAGVAMMGRAADLERIVDNRDREAEQPPLALIRAVEELTACELWLVARGGAGLRAAAGETLPLKAGPVFDALEELRLTATAAEMLDVQINGVFRSEQDALAVRDGLEALRQMASVQTVPATALRVASAATVEASNRTVTVRASLTFEDWLSLPG